MDLNFQNYDKTINPLVYSSAINIFLFKKHSTNIDTHTHMSTYLYQYTHAHPTLMSTYERLSRLDLEIHKVDHQ
jgi:hypothetical protein